MTQSKTEILEKRLDIIRKYLFRDYLVENFENQAHPIQKLTETFTSIANKCIPKKSAKKQ